MFGKKINIRELSERTDEKKLEPVFDIFWEDITKCDRPTDNSDVWFYEPVLKLKNEIVRNSYMSSVEKTYTNWILHLCIKFIDDVLQGKFLKEFVRNTGSLCYIILG